MTERYAGTIERIIRGYVEGEGRAGADPSRAAKSLASGLENLLDLVRDLNRDQRERIDALTRDVERLTAALDKTKEKKKPKKKKA